MQENQQAKLTAAMGLLERVATHLDDSQPPDGRWWRDYFVLTGDHMILTDEGWESGDSKESYADAPDSILDEVNAPETTL
jgi:hypothetical protein